MKYVLISLLFLTLATSCKDQETVEDPAVTLAPGEVAYKGDYIHIGDAAVLSTEDAIYAVEIDDRAGELDQRAEEFMRTPYDMVQVVVTGELIPNPRKKETGEGWDEMLLIDKIIEVRKSSSSSVMQAPVPNQEDN
ncbi:hypothetical protein [Nonlabens marinus]|uniref:NlpE C-terminal OB domain-containing protein n=1 Tax=Nonlabens marinus S1-08 TaxID=1454201 RepID=W8VWQ4_9FLAO|nr:hypothetical protein [Nonlabens marinus]BAO54947.1 hypothetical protein NMS_0938 [Nonlabens marinus S1-08]